MAQKVNLQERLKMRFLTVDYRDKQEVYGTSTTASDTGAIALNAAFLAVLPTVRPYFL